MAQPDNRELEKFRADIKQTREGLKKRAKAVGEDARPVTRKDLEATTDFLLGHIEKLAGILAKR